MPKPVIIDVETKKTFLDVGGNFPEKLGISVAGTYSYELDKYQAFFEKDFDKLFRLLERSSLIIGFNSSKFDIPALNPYYIGDIYKFPQLDLMEEIKKNFGRRIALNEFANETLGVKKSGHGLLAINYFHEGKFKELEKYCLDDVKITKGLYEYGRKHGKIFFKGPFGRREIEVNWKVTANGGNNNINLTLPI